MFLVYLVMEACISAVTTEPSVQRILNRPALTPQMKILDKIR